MPHTRTLTFTASSTDELANKVGDLVLPEGSTGRIELIAKRVLGVCPVPLGTAMATPLAGSIWASSLAPRGVEVTGRNGFEEICDAWVDFVVPVTQGQTVTLNNPVAVVAIVVGVAVALIALGWIILEIRLAIEQIVETVPGGGAGLGALLWVGVALLAVVTLQKFQKTRKGAS